MTLLNPKVVANADAGDADTVGGDDWDQLANAIISGQIAHFDYRMVVKELDPAVFGEGSNAVLITSNLSTGGPAVVAAYPHNPGGLGNNTLSAFYCFATDYDLSKTNYDAFEMEVLKQGGVGEGSARYRILAQTDGVNGFLHPIHIGMAPYAQMIFNTDGSINFSAMPLSSMKLGAQINFNENIGTNILGLRGSATSGLTLRANPDVLDTTERSIFLQTIDSATDTAVTALSVTPNGANPYVSFSSIRYNDVSKTNTDSPYSILLSDRIIRVDATSGAVTLTLPTATGLVGKKYDIRRTDILSSSNLVTVATTSSQTIAGAPAYYLWPGEYLTVESNGSNWEVIAEPSRTGINYYQLKGATANRRYVAGELINAPLLTSTTSPAANTLWALPLVVPKVTKFSDITFTVTTAAACNARCGIYRDTGNCYPGALVFDSGSVDCSTGTPPVEKTTTITSGIQVFPPGLYWLAWECDTANIQIRIVGGNQSLLGMLGHGNSLTANPASYGYSVAHTYGTLPDPYTASASILTTASSVGAPVPAVGLLAI